MNTTSEGPEVRMTSIPCDLSPIAEILDRVSDELHMLATQLGDISLPVEEAVSHPCGVRYPPYVRAMQELDYMRQAIAGIGDFLKRLSLDAPKNWRVDPKLSTTVLTLSQLADRLSVNSVPLTPSLIDSEGECEWF